MKIKTASLLLILTLSLFGGLIVAATIYSLSNSYEIESNWLSFEDAHSEKGRALNALRSEIGYGGMIHNFKNYVLRREVFNSDAVKSSLGGAKSAIALYRSLGLNEQEEKALDDIDSTLRAYGDALPVIGSLIKDNKSAADIDLVVKIDDGQALNGLAVLLKHVKDKASNHIRGESKTNVLSEMRYAMGFGGMIHHFKNAILRGDTEALLQAKKSLLQAQNLTETYLAFELNQAELSAIRMMQSTLTLYLARIEKIKNIDFIKMSPEAIDHLVQVNDMPALDGFAKLDKEVALQSKQSEIKLSQALTRVINAEKTVLYLTVLTIVLLLGGAYWLIKVQIIKPISLLTNTMTHIAHNNLDVEIQGTDKQDEIGEMARAVEIFKKNIYLLERAKAELSSANLDLESRVQRRTQALKKSEESLRSILETAVDAIITIDASGNIKSFNSAAEKMFGFKSDEVVDENLSLILPESFDLDHTAYIDKYLETGEAKVIGTIREMEASRKNGKTFPIHVSVSEVQSSDGVLFTGIIRDISELKAYQKSLQSSEDIANKANKAKSDFVASMNHELRTPMNAILGFTQLLERDPEEPLTKSQKESVGEIKKAGQHLLGIINQILELNKIEAGKMPVSMKQTSPSQLVQESLALILQMTDENNIELIDNIEYETLPDLFTDQMRFKQVLLNLLSNAVKYNKPGGKIILNTEVIDNKLRFSIEDTGNGIQLYRQSQIFVPFERLGHESGEIEGTGIGLSITKQIVELMQGEIGFQSEPGQGSCFWFDLPVYKTQA